MRTQAFVLRSNVLPDQSRPPQAPGFSPCHYPHLNPVWFETMELHPEDPVQWASLHFAEAELGDARRVKRAEGMAAAMLRAPGESLPLSAGIAGPLERLHWLFVHPREVKAAYRFLDNPHVDPEGRQAGHRQRVREAMQAPGTYLLIEDSSEFSYSGRQLVGGLGFIGNAREGRFCAATPTSPCARWGRWPWPWPSPG